MYQKSVCQSKPVPRLFYFLRWRQKCEKKTVKSLENDTNENDTLPARTLRLIVNEVTDPISHIINESIKKLIFPEQWKISKISPIHKTASKWIKWL